MELWSSPEDFRRACENVRAGGGRLGLVPTMGALHAGHQALIREARRRSSVVAVSVFVNPTQFAPGEDYERYPRARERDVAACEEAGASIVFAPDAAAMYPPGDETRVLPGPTAAPLCGAHRPGHFEGVATIVAKLLILAGPCIAVFGRKDYQQLTVIRRLVLDLLLPVEVVGMPTVREPDGLALSSRNAYLSPAERDRAAEIPRALADAAHLFARGERNAGALVASCRDRVARIADRIDYVDVAEPESLRVFGSEEDIGARAVLAVALKIGSTRLIDNLVLGEDPPPITGSDAPSPAGM
ncbi:pantoate--beta-alanine ligase [Chondromyces crocatus]|uniref:Pantothenate synthetase n=1 Tax=Chondromyces crocatus TaxID=52 RepID=A0A0K1EAL1_CHOCO|nr:pantoate--beta-alanine ligase [Chondromyces crocatus]AKT37712.1 pantoate--beta-alanine ligase [Chondromyces crocatus]